MAIKTVSSLLNTIVDCVQSKFAGFLNGRKISRSEKNASETIAKTHSTFTNTTKPIAISEMVKNAFNIMDNASLNSDFIYQLIDKLPEGPLSKGEYTVDLGLGPYKIEINEDFSSKQALANSLEQKGYLDPGLRKIAIEARAHSEKITKLQLKSRDEQTSMASANPDFLREDLRKKV